MTDTPVPENEIAAAARAHKRTADAAEEAKRTRQRTLGIAAGIGSAALAGAAIWMTRRRK